MTKMIVQFRQSCIKLQSLMCEGKLVPPEEGCIIKQENKSDKKIVSYKYGYHFELTNLINCLYKFDSDISNNFSHEYIKKRIEDFLFKCFFSDETNKAQLIDIFFKTLKQDLEKIDKYLIPIYIENLSFHNSEVTIGNVIFIPYSIFNIGTIFREGGYTDKMEQISLNADMKMVKSVGIVSVYAGDAKKAIEKAEECVDQSLNVIRLFYLDSEFGIQGKYNHPLIYQINILNIDQNFIHNSIGWSGTQIESKIDRTKYEKVKEYILIIDNILKKPENQRNKLEKKLILAINLYGDIQKNKGHKDNIIKIFSALETLLLVGNEIIIDNVAERISFIIESNKCSRLDVYKRMRTMYKHRNELVHEGETEFMESEFNTLLMELRQCILIIAKNIEKYPDLIDWIDHINNAREERFNVKLSFQ